VLAEGATLRESRSARNLSGKGTVAGWDSGKPGKGAPKGQSDERAAAGRDDGNGRQTLRSMTECRRIFSACALFVFIK